EGGGQTVGWPTLARALGEGGDTIVRQVREWLGVGEPPRVYGGTRASPAAARSARYRPLPPWVPFPLRALPPVISDHVRAAAASIGCDPALVALPALAAVAGAVGNSRAIVVKKGWSEPVALWTVTVADSGGHKSPAHRVAVGPLQEIQIDLD